MKKLTLTSILLIAGILLLINVLSQKFFFRLDLTQGSQYTLSDATRNVLKSLDTPITVSAYFSEDLPPELQKIKRDFKEMLVEYGNASKGNVDYEFINPNANAEKEQEAAQNGIQPLVISTREKDQSKQQKAFLGAVLKMGEQKDVIPALVSAEGMEHRLTTSIKKLSVTDKPAIGIVQGHGEPALQDLAEVLQALSVLYNVAPADLGKGGAELSQFKALAWISPADSIPPAHLAALDEYLTKGGKLFIGINRVHGDLQSQQGSEIKTGLEDWLRTKGLEVEAAFVLDAQCGSVNVQQQQGPFSFSTPVSFPYLPLLKQFPDHPITKGLEQVILPFASQVNYKGQGGSFTVLLKSSNRAATSPVPTSLQVLDKQWVASDFQQSSLPLGGVLEGGEAGSGKIVLIGDGDFPMAGQGAQSDNANLFVNSIDWLSDDTGLIELRTKGVATRPIDEAYLGDENVGKRNFLKYLNFGLPILLVLLYGFFRSQRAKNLRMRRMEERV